MFDENLIVKNAETFLNTMQKILPEIPYRYREIINILSYDDNIMFIQSQIRLTSYGFSQYRSKTDFDIKSDGFLRILA